jgi:imidazolonepropionase-like amidohydrolase
MMKRFGEGEMRVSGWKLSPLLVLALLFALPGASQDRGQFLDRSTLVSDDPRRVPVPPGPRGPEGTLVLRGGRVFDGTGAAPREMSLVIERNKIARLVPPGASDWPSEARVLDVSGKTVLPGLTDLHTHLTYTEPGIPIEQAASPGAAALRAVERLRYYIESGITSVRDTGSLGDVPFRLKEWVAQNRLAGPRVFPAGQLITATGGHGAEGLGPTHILYQAIREASGPDDFREAVREQFKRGADFIKLASHFSRDEIRAAVEEAHALGIKVTVDAETFYVQWAVEAGADCIEHPLPRSDETIRLMAQKGTAAVPTLVPYIYIFDQSGGYFHSTSRRFTFSKEANLEMLRRLKAAGIRLGVGTDLVMDWFRFLPQPYLTELKQFVAAGYGAAEALVAATRTNAEILDMADRLGTLEPGKLADVLVVGGRPDVNLDDLLRVELVIRDGYLVVEGGTVKIPRHAPKPPPSPRPGAP